MGFNEQAQESFVLVLVNNQTPPWTIAQAAQADPNVLLRVLKRNSSLVTCPLVRNKSAGALEGLAHLLVRIKP